MTTDLSSEVVLVTGASRGIGSAIADALGATGATVVGTATTESGANRISERLAEKGLQGFGMALDVNDAAACDDALKRIAADVGNVSILVNNAGITRDTLVMRMKDDDWDAVISTNLTSAFRLCRAVTKPMMKARRGCIINITSVVGLTGNAGQVNYAASKSGLIGMTRSLARELGARNITVNCVAPGFIRSDMTDSLGDDQKAALLKDIPLGDLGEPADIAAACVFLASPGARYITGHTLSVNGGMHMV